MTADHRAATTGHRRPPLFSVGEDETKKEREQRERREHERKRESGIREMNEKLGLHPIYSGP